MRDNYISNAHTKPIVAAGTGISEMMLVCNDVAGPPNPAAVDGAANATNIRCIGNNFDGAPELDDRPAFGGTVTTQSRMGVNSHQPDATHHVVTTEDPLIPQQRLGVWNGTVAEDYFVTKRFATDLADDKVPVDRTLADGRMAVVELLVSAYDGTFAADWTVRGRLINDGGIVLDYDDLTPNNVDAGFAVVTLTLAAAAGAWTFTVTSTTPVSWHVSGRIQESPLA